MFYIICDFADDARGFPARNEGEGRLRLIFALRDEDVRKVHARRFDVDAHMSRFHRGGLNLLYGMFVVILELMDV